MCPAVTRVSLFARAICLLFSIAVIVGRRPTFPIKLFIIVWEFLNEETSNNPSFPYVNFIFGYSFDKISKSFLFLTHTSSGVIVFKISLSFGMFSPTDIASNLNKSLLFLITSIDWRPIDPVAPKIL